MYKYFFFQNDLSIVLAKSDGWDLEQLVHRVQYTSHSAAILREPNSLEWSRSNQYDREPSHSPFGRNKRFQKNKRWKSNATAAWKKSNASPQSGWGTARTCRKPVTVAYNRASNLRSYSNMHRLHFNPSRHDRSSLTDCVIPIDGIVKHCTRVKHATVWNRDYAAFAGSAYSRIA